MNDGILSQEEIDALLKADSSNSVPAGGDNGYSAEEAQMSDFEKDTIGEIGNISMGSSATALSTLLHRKVSITTPNVAITTRSQLQADFPMPYLYVEVQYREGIDGSNILIIKETDAAIIASLMMGGDGSISPEFTLDEIHMSAVGEAMNQMMGLATTSLSSMFNKKIDIAPPIVKKIDLSRENLEVDSDFEEVVQIRFKMEIEDLVNSEIMQLMPIEAARIMIRNLMGEPEETVAPPLPPVDMEKRQEPAYAPPPPPPPQDAYMPPPSYAAPPQYGAPQPAYSGVQRGEQYAVQPVQFAPLHEGYGTEVPNNIGLIMDVPLDVAVELGKTKKTIKDILDLTQGSIIQLDKMAGEPVDLLVNGKLIAKGEVVVIDENYGIRITAILSPMDRMNKLQ